MTTESVLEKIRHLMNKTVERGCTEGEAAAAAELVAKLLEKHNLSVVDLETRGHKAPAVGKVEHDLGKASFKWKLSLAEVMAKHYYCHAMIDWQAKRVFFVGRPDNTEALTMLYKWVIDQIRRLAAEDRKAHIETTGEHIDPLRWQVNYGEGTVYRLRDRLRAMREKMSEQSTALVLHHDSEISDWLEANHGYRIDGQDTKAERQRKAERAERQERHSKRMATDPAYRAQYEKLMKEIEEERKEADKREARNARRRRGYSRRYYGESEESARKREQGESAHAAGSRGAERVNLEPFIRGGQAPKGEVR